MRNDDFVGFLLECKDLSKKKEFYLKQARQDVDTWTLGCRHQERIVAHSPFHTGPPTRRLSIRNSGGS